jgi:hypothetical protein
VVRGFGQLGIALSEFKVEVLAEEQSPSAEFPPISTDLN